MKNISRKEYCYSFLTVIYCSKAKTAFLLLCFLLFSSWTFTLQAQENNLSLQLNGVKLKEVLKAIEKQTPYVFFYNNADVDVNKIVSVNVTSATLTEVLNKVLTESDYSIKDKKIVLFPKGKKQTLKGKVTDDTGEPIIGANVTRRPRNSIWWSMESTSGSGSNRNGRMRQETLSNTERQQTIEV